MTKNAKKHVVTVAVIAATAMADVTAATAMDAVIATKTVEIATTVATVKIVVAKANAMVVPMVIVSRVPVIASSVISARHKQRLPMRWQSQALMPPNRNVSPVNHASNALIAANVVSAVRAVNVATVRRVTPMQRQ